MCDAARSGPRRPKQSSTPCMTSRAAGISGSWSLMTTMMAQCRSRLYSTSSTAIRPILPTRLLSSGLGRYADASRHGRLGLRGATVQARRKRAPLSNCASTNRRIRRFRLCAPPRRQPSYGCRVSGERWGTSRPLLLQCRVTLHAEFEYEIGRTPCTPCD